MQCNQIETTPELLARLQSTEVMLLDALDTVRLCRRALSKTQAVAARGERDATILELDAAGKLTRKQIAERVGVDERTVRKIIAASKTAKGYVPAASSLGASHSQSKDASDTEAGTRAESPTILAESEEESTGGIEPVEAQDGNDPVDASPVLADGTGGGDQSPSPVPDRTFTVDLGTYVAHGPKGVLRLERPIARILWHMQGFELYPVDKLAEVGGYAMPGIARTMLQCMNARLRDIGVRLHFVTNDLVKLDFVEG